MAQLIDWHTNLWLPEHLGEEARAEMGSRTGGQMDAGPEAHRALIADKTDAFLVLGLRFNRLGIRVPNEFLARYCAEFPGRAFGFMGIDATEDDAARQVEHGMKEYGLRGIKFSPVYSGFDPWCEVAWQVYAAAERLKLPILWHQSAAYAAHSTLEHGNPILLDKIGRAFPKLRMVIAHIGQPWIGETIVVLRKHKQIFADLSARYYRKWQCYNALMLALDYKVTDQLLFGSDFPIQTTEQALASFRAINDWGPGVALPPFPPEIIEDIIANRPLELLWPEG
ncbi:MAG: amidohydrolase family protein [Alphaproteobacteria bacterium]